MWPVGFIALGCQRAVYWGPKVLARSEKAKQWGRYVFPDNPSPN